MEARLARIISVGLVITGLGMSNGCIEQPRQIVVTPTVASASSGPRPPENTPLARNETEKTLILDTARFYCERTNCHKTPEEMADNVLFVEFDEFLWQIEKVAGRSMSDRERLEEQNARLEIATENGGVFVNTPLFEEVLKNPIKFIPASSMAQLRKENDPQRAITESLLIHAFSHVNGTKGIYKFSPFSLSLHDIKVPEIGKLEGFSFAGRRENGAPFYVVGSDEAITELSARIIGRRNGQYISLVRQYKDGADLVQQVNADGGISPDEFLQYQTGEFSQGTFLQKWGAIKDHNNPDEKAAILSLASIGLYVQGAGGTRSDAADAVRKWLGIKIQ